MAQQKIANAVGLSMKAGKCVSGDFSVEKALKAGKLYLVLIDAAVSESTGERYKRMCMNAGVPLHSMAELGVAIGKPARMIAGITDVNFTKLIQNALEAQPRSEGINAGV